MGIAVIPSGLGQALRIISLPLLHPNPCQVLLSLTGIVALGRILFPVLPKQIKNVSRMRLILYSSISKGEKPLEAWRTSRCKQLERSPHLPAPGIHPYMMTFAKHLFKGFMKRDHKGINLGVTELPCSGVGCAIDPRP